MREVHRLTFRHGLAVYGTLGFVAGFFVARLFATLNPSVVVVDSHSGIHFHHFWYGLVMVTLTGWLGIAINDDRLNRTLALVFGLGAGLIGDEVGLLLTFGDYTSELTAWFFVGAIGFIVVTSLFLAFRSQVEREVVHVSPRERLVQAGVMVSCISTIFFAFGNWRIGSLIAGLGIVIMFMGLKREERLRSLRTLAD